MQEPIQQIRGTRDVLPDEYEIRKMVSQEIIRAFERYGYRGIELPSIEPAELHLRKSGEAIRQHMYTFYDKGMENICLRPEFTASVVRMFNTKLQDQPLPLRLYYIGSAFRYDRPQAGRYREFTQAGVEIIGGKTEEYDAEVIALASHTMDALGISDYKLTMGNIGITLELLSLKKIDERIKGYFIESLEEISKASCKEEGIKKIKDSLSSMGISVREPEASEKELIAILKMLPEEDVKKVVAWVIQTIYGNSENRNSLEIAQNLLKKVHLREQSKEIKEVMEFIEKLTNIEGLPPDVFNKVEKLIQEYNLNKKPLDKMRKIVDYLNCYKIDWNKVSFDFGFGRGLEYYTGMIFEIYVLSPNLGESQKQVCGGGRYDTLISDLGGARSTPALGFSFGLERLLLCLPSRKKEKRETDAFVAAIGGEVEFIEALQIATTLRENGIKTHIGVKGLGPSQLTGMAKRLSSKFLIFIGEEELKGRFLTLKDMEKGSQEKYPLEKVIEIIKNAS